MNPFILRATFVIARRDFIATIMSRTFLLFLIAPLFPILFGVVFGAVGAKVQSPVERARIVLIASPERTAALDAAQQRLVGLSGIAADVTFDRVAPAQDEDAQAKALLDGPNPPEAVLTFNENDARFYGSTKADTKYRPLIDHLLSDARQQVTTPQIADQAGDKVTFIEQASHQPAAPRDLSGYAQGAQTLLFVLTLMLAGVLISNFVEEKANKVIEVLAAATPLPAMFLGKLIAMLGSSLVGVTVWASTAALGYTMLIPVGLSEMPTPAVGWPVMIALAIAYFATNYLLVGAVLLGIGAQAASIRQIQTLSLPITMAQLLLYGFAAAALADPDGSLALASAIFPFSSPLAMIARAVAQPDIWPHLVALLWQTLWVAITIALMARLFRRGVLKSGPVRRRAKTQTTA